MANELTSWTLVLGAAAAQTPEQSAFCERYAPVIRAYLAARWRLPHDHEDVADATQEVFLQCFRKGGVLQRVDRRHPGGFRPYLYGTIRNVALMTERKRSRCREENERSSFELDRVLDSGSSPSSTYDRAWALMIVRQAGDLMVRRAGQEKDGPRRAEALKLKCVEGIPAREIAERLELDVGDVYRMLRCFRAEFRDALLEVMASYHPNDSTEELRARCAELLELV